ncbi:DUF6716 putative glycosyltransferase [Microbacterium halotolerans]|uniref:DUF6716 putative glycosyltransferase n=1 Tax=Microbacterium halotolerans TaxID=246613 RepID=UPI000E6AA2DC|nr:DUF6716 putative glycosyltransferase [Microbacterium halotolerans]
MNGAGRLRIVAIADTDSYVKWAAALIGSLPGAELIVLDTPLVVSDTQLAVALRGSGLSRPRGRGGSGDRVRRAGYGDLPRLLAGADAVLLAARGPLVQVLQRQISSMAPCPVIVTGLPGISIPPTRLALHFRRGCDLFVLHSHREVREFASLAIERGIRQRFALATLPFARATMHEPAADGTDLVFAAQAKVPPEREERKRVVRLLIAAAEADPGRRVVLKLRGRPGESETHRELHSYPELLREAGDLPENLVVSTEAMSTALRRAEGLVTVSSTAAIEAAAAGVPVIALDTFGVSEQLINVVFIGSDLLAGEDDVIHRRFPVLRSQWRRDNYFHEPSDDDWLGQLRALVERRRRGGLEPREPLQRFAGRARDAWERRLALGEHDPQSAGAAAYAVGLPLHVVARAVRMVRGRVLRTRSAERERTPVPG